MDRAEDRSCVSSIDFDAREGMSQLNVSAGRKRGIGVADSRGWNRGNWGTSCLRFQNIISESLICELHMLGAFGGCETVDPILTGGFFCVLRTCDVARNIIRTFEGDANGSQQGPIGRQSHPAAL